MNKIYVLSTLLAISSGLLLASADERLLDSADAKSADALHARAAEYIHLNDVSIGSRMREFNYMLSRGADVNVVVNMGHSDATPLTVAARSGQKLKIISLLLLGANPAIEGRFEVHHPREHVARYGQFTALECARIMREIDEEVEAYYGHPIQMTETIESIEALFALSKRELADLLCPREKKRLATVFMNHLLHQRRRVTLDDAFIMHMLSKPGPLRLVQNQVRGVYGDPSAYIMEYADSTVMKPDLQQRIPYDKNGPYAYHNRPAQKRRQMADRLLEEKKQ